MVNFFAKRSEIAFPTIFEPTTGFVPSGPKFYSKPFYCSKTEVENFLLSPLDVVFFKKKNLIFFCGAFT
jgi:hypothetical protein